MSRSEEIRPCWVLWWKYSDGSGSEIERVYTDKRRAEEDYNLVENDPVKTWQLDEKQIYN